MDSTRVDVKDVPVTRFVSPITTVQKAATYLDVSEATVWRMVKDGEIPVVVRVRGAIRIPIAWLERKVRGEV